MSRFSKAVKKVSNNISREIGEAVSQPFRYIEDTTGLNFNQPFKSNPLALGGLASSLTVGLPAAAGQVAKKNNPFDLFSIANPLLLGVPGQVGKDLYENLRPGEDPENIPEPGSADLPTSGDPDSASTLAARRRRLAALRGGILSTIHGGRRPGSLINTLPALRGFSA